MQAVDEGQASAHLMVMVMKERELRALAAAREGMLSLKAYPTSILRIRAELPGLVPLDSLSIQSFYASASRRSWPLHRHAKIPRGRMLTPCPRRCCCWPQRDLPQPLTVCLPCLPCVADAASLRNKLQCPGATQLFICKHLAALRT